MATTKKYNQLIAYAIYLIVFLPFVIGIPWSPQGNIDLKHRHNITNLSYVESFQLDGSIIDGDDINATRFFQDGLQVLDTGYGTINWTYAYAYLFDNDAGWNLTRDNLILWSSDWNYTRDAFKSWNGGWNDTSADVTANKSGWAINQTSDEVYINLIDNVFTFNETELNSTVDDRDADTTYTADENYINMVSTVVTMNETELNDTIDSRFAVVYYNASAVEIITGTPVGSLSNTYDYDGVAYNISETTGAPGLNVTFNFTGVSNFNEIVMRVKIADAQHEYNIYLYDNTTSSWESYAEIGGTDDFEVYELGVYDSADHILDSDGNVKLKILQTSAGNAAHKLEIDWLQILKGPSTFNTIESDPLAIHKDAINTTQLNYTDGILNILTTWLQSLFVEITNANAQFLNISDAFLEPTANARYFNITDAAAQFANIDTTTINISSLINHSVTGITRSFANGCVEIANSTGIYLEC